MPGIVAPKESHVDVLVIGAGPAGLMCANALATAGVNVRIVDKRAHKVAAGHADGIQPRTIEVLQSYGLAERLLKEGNQMHMAAFYNPGPNGGIERTGRAPDVTAPTARYPFEVTLHQGAIEDIFVASMAEHGLAVERPVVPTSIQLSADAQDLADPQAYPVTVALNRLDGEVPEEAASEVVHAKFAVGADGAHSWVRKSFGITMEGEHTDYIWGVVDIIPDTDFPDIRNRTAVHSENGSCMVIPREGDLVRLYIQLESTELMGADGRLNRSATSARKLLDVAKKSFYPYHIDAIGEPKWWTIYHIGQRVASQFSVSERVFITGDACHTHSPKAGQGMNASMNDSHNLVWKLTHVLRGWADMSLLKTYEHERRKYAQDLIAFDKKFAALFSTKPKSADADEGVSHEEFLDVFQTFGLFTSGIGIHYAPSAIVDTTHQHLARRLAIGQRIPPQTVLRAADARPCELQDLLPADGRFKLLIFSGALADPTQRAALQALARELVRPEALCARLRGERERARAFDVLTICTDDIQDVDYTEVPPALRSHWSKVLVDGMDLTKTVGGKTYESYGIDESGAVVVVRPDGYVATVAPLSKIGVLDTYFSAFMSSS